MKVCIVTTAFPRWKGDGRAPFIYEAARAIQSQGNEVRVVAMHSPGAAKHEWLDNLEIFRKPYLPQHLETLQKESGGLPSAWKSGWPSRLVIIPFMLAHFITTIKIARNCDVIHANWTLSAFIVWISSIFHRKPYIVTVQGSDIYQAVHLPFVARLTCLALSNARRVLALSQSLADSVILLGIPKDKVEVIPNGVDLDKFTPGNQERANHVLFVGSLTERKGVHFLIEAFPEVVKHIPGAILEIIGEGSRKDSLIDLANRTGITDHVIFRGSRNQVEVHEAMASARVFVLPSIEEGLGVVLLEALACGTPCVGSQVGGIPDVITPDVGILVHPGNPLKIAEGIKKILLDPQLWQEMSSHARQRAEQKYSWSIIAARITQIYNEILA